MQAATYTEQIVRYLSNQFSLSEEQIRSMLPEFKKTLGEHIVVLKEQNSKGQLQNLAKAAHTIKGAFLNLGLSDCAALAVQLEISAANNNPDEDYDLLVARISSLVAKILAE